MPAKRDDITKDLLVHLYVEQCLSMSEIGRQLNCAASTVARHLAEHSIPKRTLSEATTFYPRYDFDGTDWERAYLLGFRLGDLHVKPTSPGRCSLEVGGKTTRIEQVKLFRSLFEFYGYPYVGGPDKRGEYTLVCRLNSSFSFLLPNADNVPKWVVRDSRCSAAFAAGYTDAEGSFYTFYHKSRGEWRSGFNIASQQEIIICWFHEWLLSIGAQCPAPVADDRKSYKKTVWLIVVRRKAALLALIEHLEPYLRHPKRRADMERVRANVFARNRKRPQDDYDHQ
jgi:hypothetical protein